MEEELEEVRNRAQQYENEVAEESQGEDMELMSSQVSYLEKLVKNLDNKYQIVNNREMQRDLMAFIMCVKTKETIFTLVF